jgi:hypothetical protein
LQIAELNDNVLWYTAACWASAKPIEQRITPGSAGTTKTPDEHGSSGAISLKN